MRQRKYNARRKKGKPLIPKGYVYHIKSRFRRGKKAYKSDTEKRSAKWKALAHRYYDRVILAF